MSMLVCFLVCMMHVFVLPVCMYTMCVCLCVFVCVRMHLCIYLCFFVHVFAYACMHAHATYMSMSSMYVHMYRTSISHLLQDIYSCFQQLGLEKVRLHMAVPASS